MTDWHCKIGKADDLEAVVDIEGRVIGIQVLRVLDASSLPLPPGALAVTIITTIITFSSLSMLLIPTSCFQDALVEKNADDIKVAHFCLELPISIEPFERWSRYSRYGATQPHSH